MGDLSLKGVARRYGGLSGNFSVLKDVYGLLSSPIASISLRSKLESMAREEHLYTLSQCGGLQSCTVAFEQTWTHITVRLMLDPDTGITNTTLNNLRNTWKNGIENTWSNRWGCRTPGELTCTLTFEVQWVTTNQHFFVRVRPGPETSSVGNHGRATWDTLDTGAVASHEFGHMIGNRDEYLDSNCPDRDPADTGTVMDNNTNIVPARMMRLFAYNIGSDVVVI